MSTNKTVTTDDQTSIVGQESLEPEAISIRLRAPLPAQDLQVRQGHKRGNTAQLLFYVNGSTIEDRLDEVIGPGQWSYSCEPYRGPTDSSSAVVVGILNISMPKYYVSVSAIGEASGSGDIFMTAETTAFKRSAKKIGVGRYLYRMPEIYWPVDDYGLANKADLAEFVQRVGEDIAAYITPELWPVHEWLLSVPAGRPTTGGTRTVPPSKKYEGPASKPSSSPKNTGKRFSGPSPKQCDFIVKLMETKFANEDELNEVLEELHLSLDYVTWDYDGVQSFIAYAKERPDSDPFVNE